MLYDQVVSLKARYVIWVIFMWLRLLKWKTNYNIVLLRGLCNIQTSFQTIKQLHTCILTGLHINKVRQSHYFCKIRSLILAFFIIGFFLPHSVNLIKNWYGNSNNHLITNRFFYQYRIIDRYRYVSYRLWIYCRSTVWQFYRMNKRKMWKTRILFCSFQLRTELDLAY